MKNSPSGLGTQNPCADAGLEIVADAYAVHRIGVAVGHRHHPGNRADKNASVSCASSVIHPLALVKNTSNAGSARAGSSPACCNARRIDSSRRRLVYQVGPQGHHLVAYGAQRLGVGKQPGSGRCVQGRSQCSSTCSGGPNGWPQGVVQINGDRARGPRPEPRQPRCWGCIGGEAGIGAREYSTTPTAPAAFATIGACAHPSIQNPPHLIGQNEHRAVLLCNLAPLTRPTAPRCAKYLASSCPTTAWSRF